MDKNFGKKYSNRLQSTDRSFKQKIMSFVGDQNMYRKSMPSVFNKEAYDKMDEVEDFVRKSFKPVHVGSNSPKKATSPVKDTEHTLSHVLRNDATFVRRLKMANYGSWYLSPEVYEKKVRQLNEELNTANSH